MIERVLLAIDAALHDSDDAFEIDRLFAARQVLVQDTVPHQGRSTRRKATRRVFVKWCSGCPGPRPRGAFNRNRSKRDGLQDVCRECQRRIYQQHCGALAEDAS